MARKSSESIGDYYATFNEQKDAVEAEAAKCSSEAFLAHLFTRMADDERCKPLKDWMDNYPVTVVEAKQPLAGYIPPEKSGGRTKSSRTGHKKTVQCYGCGKKEHYPPKCTKASEKEEVLAVMKSGDAETFEMDIVNTAVEEESEDSVDDPPQ